MGSRDRERLDPRRRRNSRSRTPENRREWGHSVNNRRSSRSRTPERRQKWIQSDSGRRNVSTHQERNHVSNNRYSSSSSTLRRSKSRSPIRSRSPNRIRAPFHDIRRSRHSLSRSPSSQHRPITYRTHPSDEQNYSPRPERRRSPTRERRRSPVPNRDRRSPVPNRDRRSPVPSRDRRGPVPGRDRMHVQSRSPHRSRNHSRSPSGSSSQHQRTATGHSRNDALDQGEFGRERSHNTVVERSNNHKVEGRSDSGSNTNRHIVSGPQEREKERKETRSENKISNAVQPNYVSEGHAKPQTLVSSDIPSHSEKTEKSPEHANQKILSPVVDPILQRRQEARLDAYRALWKCESLSNQASLTYLSCEADLVIAEYLLSLQVKNLEDVGRRMECQDWNFKVLESDEIELSELMMVPQLEGGTKTSG